MTLTIETEPVIQLQNISVCYRLPRERLSGIKEYTIRWVQRRLHYDEFWALRDVSFRVLKGEIFGVIGQNGAGKSTMLKVMARVLKPMGGRIVTHGKVAPLLEVGGGFHPELTGRENIYLNSALLGRSRAETDQLIDQIVEFAEIDDFVDVPLRTYSTGMAARLGFSVATCVRPDILLIDEVLSVGDALFQKKCLDRMYSFRDQGTTIVIVTHSLSTIEGLCDRTLWLGDGKIKMLGNPHEVAREYVQLAPPLEEPTENHLVGIPTLQMSTPQADPILVEGTNYVILPEIEHLYPAASILNLQEGSICFWLKFAADQNQSTAILFHSDDSRFVIYADTDPETESRRIVARAGGNRQAIDPFYGSANFPEVAANLDDHLKSQFSFSYDEWHLVTMTWRGYPEGDVRLFLDGYLAGETRYTRQHDNRYRLPIQLAVGIRPGEWMGEVIQRHDGTLTELHPQATAAVTGSGKEMREVRLYRVSLSASQIQEILSERDDVF